MNTVGSKSTYISYIIRIMKALDSSSFVTSRIRNIVEGIRKHLQPAFKIEEENSKNLSVKRVRTLKACKDMGQLIFENSCLLIS